MLKSPPTLLCTRGCRLSIRGQILGDRRRGMCVYIGEREPWLSCVCTKEGTYTYTTSLSGVCDWLYLISISTLYPYHIERSLWSGHGQFGLVCPYGIVCPPMPVSEWQGLTTRAIGAAIYSKQLSEVYGKNSTLLADSQYHLGHFCFGLKIWF